jgi:hypothetical protein
MKLTQARTQDELVQLTNRELRRRLLESTPLNLPAAILYALCFTLMPGAVLGGRLGMVSTAVLAGMAAYFWLWGEPSALDSFLWFWLLWALVDWVVIMLLRLLGGVREFRRGRAFWLPEEEAGAVDLQPGGCVEYELAQDEERRLELVVQAPAKGVYVLEVRADDGESHLKIGFDEAPCMEESESVPGLVNAACAAYRLEPGCHCLEVLLQGQTAGKVSIRFRG